MAWMSLVSICSLSSIILEEVGKRKDDLGLRFGPSLAKYT